MEQSFRPLRLRSARREAGLTQQQAAQRLHISQAYLALLERGRRPVTAQLGPKIAKLYRLGPTALPLSAAKVGHADSSSLAAGLAALGYLGFRQPARTRAGNPANLLLAAIAASDLEVRVLEALPWLAAEYSNLDWEWLIRQARLRDLQNRLGFIMTLARQVAERKNDPSRAQRLHEIEKVLDRSRLVREDTLCQDSLSEAERRWLRRARPFEAVHWNLLTDLNARGLRYAA